MFFRQNWSQSATEEKELQKDIPAIYEILKKGSEKAEAVAAQTLKEVKDAMKINYFDDKALIEAQAERFFKIECCWNSYNVVLNQDRRCKFEFAYM